MFALTIPLDSHSLYQVLSVCNIFKQMTKKFKDLIYRLRRWAYGKLCFSSSIVTDVGDDVQSNWVKDNLNISSIFRWRVRSHLKKKFKSRWNPAWKKIWKEKTKPLCFSFLLKKTVWQSWDRYLAEEEHCWRWWLVQVLYSQPCRKKQYLIMFLCLFR